MQRSLWTSSMSVQGLVLLQSILVGFFLASARECKGLKAISNDRAAASAEDFHVAPATGRIQDRTGRERIFHGLNVVVKGPPWHPRVDSFDPQFSFTDADVALLKEWGMNVVRLGVMWPGVEPKRGQVNATYMDLIQTIITKLHTVGIYTLLEFHQDLFAAPFCGEGLPSWVLDDTDYVNNPQPAPRERSFSGGTLVRSHDSTDDARLQEVKGTSSAKRYPASFPEPLGRRWPSEWEEDGWEPSVESCNKHAWWWYYFSYAVSRAFQDLYENKWGWGDLLARYWTTVATAFKDEPGVIGYELMNEPWPGDIFRDPFLLLPGVADSKNLVRFYENLAAAVRSVDSEKLLFFETITFDNFWCGLQTVPGGHQWRNKTVLSYHYYAPPNFSPKQAFSERLKESKRLGCGSMLTEFFVSTEKRGSKFWELRDAVLGRTAGVVNERNSEGSSSRPRVALKVDAGDISGADSSGDGSSTKSTPTRDWAIIESLAEESGQPSAKSGAGRVPQTDKKSDNSVDGVLMAADAHVQSWIGWEYKAYYTKTGSIVEQSLFGDDGKLNIVLAKKLARTYPRAVCGHIRSFSFDPTNSLFSMSYVAEGECIDEEKQTFAHTEIFVHRNFYYKKGLSVDVNRKCAFVEETSDIVIIRHTFDCFDLAIDVTIRQLEASE